MYATASRSSVLEARHGELQFATFCVDALLLGVDICQIQEINRHLDLTRVPLAPPFVAGVANLRGEVVTMIDLRSVLGLPSADGAEQRFVILRCGAEVVGLTVDRIADVLTIAADDLVPPPPRVGTVEGRFFSAVCALQQELLVLLNVEEIFELA